jgi:hypothetical protein
MKKVMCLLLCTTVLFQGCSKSSNNDIDASLVGKWQAVEFCDNNGDNTWTCRSVEDGFTLKLIEEGMRFEYFGVTNPACVSGTFTFDEAELTLQFDNNECTTNNGTFFYRYYFVENQIQLWPSGESIFCDEGCYTVYNKVRT